MELFKLIGTIAIENSEANKGIEETASKASSAHSKISAAFSKIGKAAATCGKAMAAGLAAGATAMAGLTTKAISLGGELEQNMGGSEAVFGEHAKRMQETATTAFASMGLSASDYLATANKMGSLMKGAGFEAADAADISAQAMQRAADVASIMGISTEMAMESIAGAAKGNFTMMDNLGVAMNDTQLQYYALEKGITKSTMSMTQQEKIGLAMEMFLEKTAYAAGNYTKENETLAGSLTTAKAAIVNFLSGAGDVTSLVDALVNAGGVISVKLQELLPRLVEGVNSLIQQLMPYLPPMLQELLPGLIEGAVSLLSGLIKMLPELTRILIAALIENFPALIEAVSLLFSQIWQMIVSAAQSAWALIQAIWRVVGAWFDQHVITPVKTRFSNFWQWLTSSALAAWQGIQNAFSTAVSWFSALKDGIVGVWQSMWTSIKGVINSILGGVESWINGVISAINRLIDGLNELVEGAGSLLGLDWSIPNIKKVSLPRLERGGILEKGQVGLLEGSGAEAVVPLDQNRAWISAVAADMNTAIGGDNRKLQQLIDLLELLIDILPDTMKEAFASMKFDINNREFARLVKAVN